MPPELPRRLEAAIAAATRQLVTIRVREGDDAHAAAVSGEGDQRAALLPRIRTLVAEVVRPLIDHRRRFLDEIGALWVGEEVWRRGNLPRVFIEYRSRMIAPEAPAAALILGFHPDDQVIVTRSFKSPMRHTATRLCRFQDLSPEIVAQEIDAFLAAAVLGEING